MDSSSTITAEQDENNSTGNLVLFFPLFSLVFYVHDIFLFTLQKPLTLVRQSEKSQLSLYVKESLVLTRN